ncbi:DUF423 domain-containing protein [Devosia faecipullorum]|uniref:DUF423 domain-containing protein n=1 Tax=Devosia faecipullorum TaxID=2755039 RepID=UPI00187BBC30|nr:DUF423 domain-containing protein [Devosia faecipullorum]MBE7732228.1 DUF423 domain-containing protein [Devosia faecipullorum]
MDHYKQGLLLVVAGLVGAAGVAAAAGSSHMAESRNLAGIAAIGLSHGPALLALGLFGNSRMLLAAGWILAAGTLVFAGDLGLREWTGNGLFPGAAPLGGGGMMLGWAFVALAGFFGPNRKKINKD